MKVRDGDGELEAAGTGAAGVEIEDALVDIRRGLVGVAEDHDGDAGGLGLEVEVCDGMQHVDQMAVELDGFGGGELGGGAGRVDVAADGGDGCDDSEAVEDGDVADVPSVEDVGRAAESVEGFGAEQAVGVGEDGDLHVIFFFNSWHKTSLLTAAERDGHGISLRCSMFIAIYRAIHGWLKPTQDSSCYPAADPEMPSQLTLHSCRPARPSQSVDSLISDAA